MSENVLVHSGAEELALERPRAFDTIMYGGIIVGVLDGLYAVIATGLRGVSPTRVFQFIASALLGRAAFDGGFKTALLGGLLHFLIAFLIAAVYYGASLRFPILIRRAILWGLSYGVAVYFVMNYIVLPLTAVQRARTSPSFAQLLIHVIGHALLVGLPVALIARWSARKASRQTDI
ncbi:MAG: hypothetical protein H7Z38_22360 [Rubrivivax sp.]|nr:hypothetical protein [Pyrinomonadaceae bacterium]